MEGVEMAETKLTITKEQAEAFANWKKEYREDIRFAKMILKQELGDECGKSKLYAMLNCIGTAIRTMDIQEGLATVYQNGIVSDIQFGREFERYLNRISDNLKEFSPEIEDRLCDKHLSNALKIFNL